MDPEALARGVLISIAVFLVVFALVLIYAVIVGAKQRGNLTKLMRGEGVMLPYDGPMPAAALACGSEINDLGLSSLGIWQDENGSVIMAWWRDRDGTVAELLVGPPAAPLQIDFTTVVEEGRGLVVTSNSGLGLSGWHRELRQVFVAARPAELLTQHDAALAHVVSKGVRLARMPAEAYTTVRLSGLSLKGEELSKKPLRVHRDTMRVFERVHADLGFIGDNPTTPRKISAIRRAPVGIPGAWL